MAEGGLDLAELDAKAAYLHLVVGAPEAVHAAVGIDAGEVAGAIEAGILRAFRPRVGEEFLGGQVGAPKVAGGDPGAADAQFAGFAARQQAQAVFHGRVDDQQGVVGQRDADGHRLAGMQFGEAGRDRGLGRAIGVEDLAAGPRPAADQCFRAGLAAEVDQAQVRNVAGKQREQGRHRMQHGDIVFDQRPRQGVGVGGKFARGDPQAGADQIADPDFLEGHVEGQRKPLVDAIIFTDAEDGVFAAQEMADRALVDPDALGLAGRARGVDDVGRVRRQDAAAAQAGGRTGGRQCLGRPQRAAKVEQGMGVGGASQQAGCVGVGETDPDAVDRRIGIERQPGGAALGDPQLHDQQVDAARQPEPDDLPGADAGLDQAGRHAVGQFIEFAIGQRARPAGEGDSPGDAAGGCLEQVGQHLGLDQFGQRGAGEAAQVVVVGGRLEFLACGIVSQIAVRLPNGDQGTSGNSGSMRQRLAGKLTARHQPADL